MLALSCEVCSHTEFAEIEVARLYTGDQPLHVCKNCGMVQVINRRPPKEIFDDWWEQSPGDDIYLAADAAVRARHAYVASFLNPHPNDNILDIGGGDGRFSSYVREMHDTIVDYNTGMAEDLPLAKNDVATILWTLENCGSAKALIQAAHDSTHEDGVVVVATGSRILVPFKKPLQYYLGKAPLDLHPWRFSANTLVSLLAYNGFKVLGTNRYIDSDILIVKARKGEGNAPRDNYRDVIDFFNRWHKESQYY
jgi:hypothetical protein